MKINEYEIYEKTYCGSDGVGCPCFPLHLCNSLHPSSLPIPLSNLVKVDRLITTFDNCIKNELTECADTNPEPNVKYGICIILGIQHCIRNKNYLNDSNRHIAIKCLFDCDKMFE